jgi:hypothetical protein
MRDGGGVSAARERLHNVATLQYTSVSIEPLSQLAI